MLISRPFLGLEAVHMGLVDPEGLNKPPGPHTIPFQRYIDRITCTRLPQGMAFIHPPASSFGHLYLCLILWEYRTTLPSLISANKGIDRFTTLRPFRFHL